MPVEVIEVVIIVIVVAARVEAVALEYDYFCLVSSSSHTTSPVIFNFTHQTFLRYCCYTVLKACIQKAFCSLDHLPPSKFHENFTFIALADVIIVVIVVVLIFLVLVLNSGCTSSLSNINILSFASSKRQYALAS